MVSVGIDITEISKSGFKAFVAEEQSIAQGTAQEDKIGATY